jgi:antitoxin (DNA-binding transcriptional repressor) of toxin-antitoxin stability system
LERKLFSALQRAGFVVRGEVGQHIEERIRFLAFPDLISQLVDRAEAGEEIIIARGGRPAARLVPFRAAVVERKPGRMRGRIRVAADFDAPLPPHLFDSEE